MMGRPVRGAGGRRRRRGGGVDRRAPDGRRGLDDVRAPPDRKQGRRAASDVLALDPAPFHRDLLLAVRDVALDEADGERLEVRVEQRVEVRPREVARERALAPHEAVLLRRPPVRLRLQALLREVARRVVAHEEQAAGPQQPRAPRDAPRRRRPLERRQREDERDRVEPADACVEIMDLRGPPRH